MSDIEHETMNTNQILFLKFVRAGLFAGVNDRLLTNGAPVNWDVLFRLAEEQSVIGLVSAGIDTLSPSERPAQPVILQFVGGTINLEWRNKAMNAFVADLFEKLQKEGIYAVLVKGQGVAQCYERPFWRACGDVDLLLSKENYERAKGFLIPLATCIDKEDKSRLHLAMTISGWTVELHGSLFTGLSKCLNRVIEQVQLSIFNDGEVRSWLNRGTLVFLPSANCDAFLVFSHILEHFYVEGIGLRQICDWCRLLWIYKDEIDVNMLERRLRDAKILTEWRGFAAMAIDYLGMPVRAMPLYVDMRKWHKKAERIIDLVLQNGNFGHNKDTSYRAKLPQIMGLLITLFRRTKEFIRLSIIFPKQAPRIFGEYIIGRIKANAF